MGGYFGRTMLAEIGAPELRGFADHVASRGVKRDTVRLALAPVKALLATAHEDGLTRSNPAVGLRSLLPTDVEREAEKVKALAPEDLRALLDATPEAWRLFFGFLAESGLRIGEARGSLAGRRPRFPLALSRVALLPRQGRAPEGSEVAAGPALRVDGPRAVGAAGGDARRRRRSPVRGGGGARIDTSNLMTRVLKPAAVEAGLGEWVKTKRGVGRRRGWGSTRSPYLCDDAAPAAGTHPRFSGCSDSDPGFTLRRYVYLLDSDLPEPGFLDTLPAAEGGNGMETRRAETGRDDGTANAAEMV